MAKRKFQIGDKVRVRPDLKIGDLKFGFVFTRPMAELKGQTLTIKGWCWGTRTYMFEKTCIEMPAYFLEKVDSAPVQLAPKFKVDDKVKLKQDLVVDQWYGNMLYTRGMDFYKNEVWTIKRIDNGCHYVISCPNNSNWCVSKEMIELYVEEQSKCCEGKIVNCTEPTPDLKTPMKKELELPKEAFEVTGPKEPSSLIARRKNRKIYYTADKPIC